MGGAMIAQVITAGPGQPSAAFSAAGCLIYGPGYSNWKSSIRQTCRGLIGTNKCRDLVPTMDVCALYGTNPMYVGADISMNINYGSMNIKLLYYIQNKILEMNMELMLNIGPFWSNHWTFFSALFYV